MNSTYLIEKQSVCWTVHDWDYQGQLDDTTAFFCPRCGWSIEMTASKVTWHYEQYVGFEGHGLAHTHNAEIATAKARRSRHHADMPPLRRFIRHSNDMLYPMDELV